MVPFSHSTVETILNDPKQKATSQLKMADHHPKNVDNDPGGKRATINSVTTSSLLWQSFKGLIEVLCVFARTQMATMRLSKLTLFCQPKCNISFLQVLWPHFTPQSFLFRTYNLEFIIWRNIKIIALFQRIIFYQRLEENLSLYEISFILIYRMRAS